SAHSPGERGDYPGPRLVPTRWCRGRDRDRRSSGEALQLVFGDVVIAPDGLDVVIFLEAIDQLHQLLGVAAPYFHFGRGPPGEFGAFAFAEHRLERAGDFVEAVDAGPDSVAVLVRFNVLGADLDRRFQDLFCIARAGWIFDQAEAREAVADASAGTEVAAVLGEDRADVGRGPVPVVGQGLHNDRRSARSEALVADFLIILRIAGGGLVDRSLDVVLGHGLSPGSNDRRAQPCVCVRVGQAHLRGDSDLAAQLGEEGRALLILRPLPVHDVLEFGMARHSPPYSRPRAAR